MSQVKLLYSFPPTVSPSLRLCPRGTEAGDKSSSSTFGQGNYIPYVKLLWRQRGEQQSEQTFTVQGMALFELTATSDCDGETINWL